MGAVRSNLSVELLSVMFASATFMAGKPLSNLTSKFLAFAVAFRSFR